MVYIMNTKQVRKTRILIGAALAAVTTLEELTVDASEALRSKVSLVRTTLDYAFESLQSSQKDLKWSLRVIDALDKDVSKLEKGIYNPETLLKYARWLTTEAEATAGTNLAYKLKGINRLLLKACADIAAPDELNADIAFYLYRKLQKLIRDVK